MRRLLALLLGALLCWPAWAQQVPNPAPMDVVVGWVGTNAQLKARTYKAVPVYRAGFAAPGDGGAATYTYSAAACTLNGGNGDDGSQVKDNAAGCWNIEPQGAIDVRVWGAKASSGTIDAGPAIRAASYYSEVSGVTITVPKGTFYLNSLDPEGTGALVIGKTTVNAVRNGANFAGQGWTNHPDVCMTHTPVFVLGNGLNRPLILSKANSASSRIEKMCLSGNREHQAGYPGGPGGKLYTVVTETQTGAPPESSIILSEVTVTGGYNGNIYSGGARGIFYAYNIFSVYSGQDQTDISIRLEGYDNFLYNVQQGISTGYGIATGNNINTVITAGAAFSNGKTGLFVDGQETFDLQVSNFRMQSNGCNGLEIGPATVTPGRNAGGHVYTGLVFDSNSTSGDGACSDIYHHGNALYKDTFVGTVFGGPTLVGQPRPKYNFEVGPGGGARVFMNGTVMDDDAANLNGFTNDFKAIVGDHQFIVPWTPLLQGSTSLGGGTSTSVGGFPTGNWSRYGKQVTITGAVNLLTFSATGDLVIGGLPLSSAPNSFSTCALSRVMGWTGTGGYTYLNGSFTGSNNYISIMKAGSGLGTQPSNVTEWTPPIQVAFSCSYPTDQ